MNNEQNKRWISITEYVDIETGEIITKSLYEREYYLTGKKVTKIEENGKYKIKKHVQECRKNGQLRLL